MSDGSSEIVELFIRSIEKKHDLTFDKEKEEYASSYTRYFRVLFDTYLNGQGNPDELREYIAAGIDNAKVIDILALEVVDWQAKAVGLRAAQEAKKTEEAKEANEGKEQEADNKKATEIAAAAAKVKQEDKAV